MAENIDCGSSLQMEFEAEDTYTGTFLGTALMLWYNSVLPDMEAAVQSELNDYSPTCVPVTGCDDCTQHSENIPSGGLDIKPDVNDPTKGTVTVIVRVYNITGCVCKNKPSKARPPKKKKVNWKAWLLTPKGKAYLKLKEQKIKLMKEHVTPPKGDK
jgi:hypothetical protein